MLSWKAFQRILLAENFLRKNVSAAATIKLFSTLRNDEKSDKQQKFRKYVLFGGLFSTFIAYEFYKRKTQKTFSEGKVRQALQINNSKQIEPGKFVEGLPTYKMQEIEQHTERSKKVWVTYKRGVYDITDFLDQHPGGDQIMIAAGSSVEPFWMLYAVHLQNPQIHQMLESMRIGNVDEEEAEQFSKGENSMDPYSADPPRHKILKPASVRPFNAETPANLLVDNFITPNELFYVRNHLPVPEIDPKTYELEVECEGRDISKNFTLEELKKFPKHSVTVAIMCAGNRRSEMTQVKAVKGLDWKNGAIGNAVWTGALLVDVLKAAGITDDGQFQHIQFEGNDRDSTSAPYGASIPIWKAFEKRCDVILAYEMNGKPIPRDHGFPIRVIVPGVVGARNVKWLGRIVLSKNESNSHWQQNDYKGFSPSTDWDTVDFKKSPAIQELPVISSICKPSDGETVKVIDGYITVQGYAYSGGGQKIVRIDVTADEGKSWIVANIEQQDQSEPPQHYGWTLWTAKVPVERNQKSVTLWAKAVDSNYNTQPESFQNIWNLRGVLSNAYHRVKVQLKW